MHLTAWTIVQVKSRRPVKPPERLPRPGDRQPARRRMPDLSLHPNAQPLPEKYRSG
ncbi:hypothetical protein F4556_005180 [Kitasatospora gansuensis]|uniref:Uncharacterized protein n=1 Tax=Kitasatospora gansuensis TaxID=258050 RepID=A0A7W7SFR9_9ACTN|nr:hypothetical protein [Kitasatospora gansuensis]MBB4949645.1 hypothetical protein [Kitasatospora gansuensis]